MRPQNEILGGEVLVLQKELLIHQSRYRPFAVGPLFTRDPGHIIELHILIGMMVSAAGMSGIRYTR